MLSSFGTGPTRTPATHSKSAFPLASPRRLHRQAKPTPQSLQHTHVKCHGFDPSDLWQPLACQCRAAKHRTRTHSPDRAAAAMSIFLCPNLASRAKQHLRFYLLQWRGAGPVLFLQPKLWLGVYLHDTSQHWWRKLLLHRQTRQHLQYPLQPWL